MIIREKNRFLKNNQIKIIATTILLLIMMLFMCTTQADARQDRDFEKEEKIGQKMADRIEKKYGVIEDEEKLDKVKFIGKHLQDISGYPEINYQFHIIDREGPNAYAFPGGFIFLTPELFEYIHSDDELAAVIAHEMGHVIHQHSIKQMQDNRKMKIVELVAILLTGDPAIGLLGELTTITLLNSYRREYEEEADLTALELLIKSPVYYPVALLTYFERVNSEYLLKPDRNLGIFQTHPDVQERIKKVKQYLRDNGIEVDRRLTTNYLWVDGEVRKQGNIQVARILLNEEEILSFSGSEEESLYRKMMEVKSKLDRSLTIDLEPYEIVLYTDGEKSTLRIGSEKIISLSREEIDFLNVPAAEVLQQAKEKISRIFWQLKLKLPALLVTD